MYFAKEKTEGIETLREGDQGNLEEYPMIP